MERFTLCVVVIGIILGAVFSTSCISGIEAQQQRHCMHATFESLHVEDADFTDVSIQEIVQHLQWVLHLASTSSSGCIETNRTTPALLLACPEPSIGSLPRISIRVGKETLSSVIERAAVASRLQFLITPDWALIAPEIHREQIHVDENWAHTKNKLENIEIPLVDCRNAKLNDFVADLCSSEMQSNSSTPFTRIYLDHSLDDLTISIEGRFISLYDLLKVMTCILPCRVVIRNGSVQIEAIPGI